jgi:methionine-rich copper-binding protein CopC
MTSARAFLASVFLAIAITLASGTALAHAFLDHAVPAVGSTVHAAPRSLRLWFTERLEPAFSHVRVFDASGKPVDGEDARVDASDPSILSVTLPPLPPGSYRVAWRVVSADTHVTEGDFTFDVAP